MHKTKRAKGVHDLQRLFSSVITGRSENEEMRMGRAQSSNWIRETLKNVSPPKPTEEELQAIEDNVIEEYILPSC